MPPCFAATDLRSLRAVQRKCGEGALAGIRRSADAANEVRKSAAEQHQQNGKTIRMEGAKMQMETGISARFDAHARPF